MKILVTGGCGFIGSNFIKKQIINNYNTILNYDKLTYAGNKNNLTKIRNSEYYTFIKGDICNSKLISDTINNFRPDILVHFAAESHVDRSIDKPLNFIDTNIIGTSVLLESSLKYLKKINKPFRFIHVSTDEVYGSLDDVGKFTELSPYNPSSPYSASKASSDFLVKSWFRTYDFPSIITNCSNNYGPYQFPEKLIPLIITNCFDEKPLPVYGSGENIRDWLYVDDHCNAINMIISKGILGNTYNIGGNNEIKNIDIVTTICSILDKVKPRQNNKLYSDLIKYIKDRPGHDFRYAIDSTKIKNEIGWEPQSSFISSLNKTVLWYLNNENWWRPIK